LVIEDRFKPSAQTFVQRSVERFVGSEKSREPVWLESQAHMEKANDHPFAFRVLWLRS
jgi:hypothetical protein